MENVTSFREWSLWTGDPLTSEGPVTGDLNATESSTAAAKPLVRLIDQGFISASVYASFLAVYEKSTLVVSSLSLLFCAVNAYVYWGQRSGAFAVYIVGVSVCDGLYSLMDLVVNLSRHFVSSTSWWRMVSTWYLNIYFGTSIRRTAICLNALASLERFFAIAFPLKVQGTGLFSLAPKRTAAAMAGVSLLAHSYMMFEHNVENVALDVWTMRPSKLRVSDPDSFQIGKNGVRGLLFFLPLVMSLALNMALVIALNSHFSNRNNMRTSTGKTGGDGQVSEERRKTESQTTKLILVLTFTFTLIALPRAVNVTLATYIHDYYVYRRQFYLYQLVTQITQQLTHATEIVLFCVSFSYSRRFRRTVSRMPCLRMCVKAFCRSRPRSSAETTLGTSDFNSEFVSQTCDTRTETVNGI